MAEENMDEAIARMQAEDELDAARAGLLKMTPVKYARARKINPPLVYYYIRTGRLKTEKCICGDTVIDIAAADEFFAELDQKKRARAGGVESA
jgi:hypothetical protein